MGIDNIKIFDTTLRDGEQTPGASLTSDDKVEIARQLDRMGVNVIEAGSPFSSEGDIEAVKKISRLGLNADICGLARALRKDIDLAIQCDVDTVHTFISTSDIQMKHALNMDREQVLSVAVDSVEYIKNHGLICEFSPMDATRTKIDFLKQICKVVEDAGADRINIPDTVGIMTPLKMMKFIRNVKEFVKIPISVHCHDDFGMAVANSLAGVEGGANQVHVTVNGLGERAGNASLEEVVMSLHLILDQKTGINTKLIYRTSQLVSRLTGIAIQSNKAIVGENAFAHESGIHTRGIVEFPLTFEPIKPELVGRRRRLVAGKLSGSHGLRVELDELGIHPNKVQLNEILNQVKKIGDRGRIITDADLMKIASTVIGLVPLEDRIIELTELAVMMGTKITPTTSVKITINGKNYTSAETGVGPVDAAMRAIQKITSNLVNVRLKEYRLEALTGGSDATAAVLIKVEDNEGNIVSARSTNEDIVMASSNAMIDGINRLLIRKKKILG